MAFPATNEGQEPRASCIKNSITTAIVETDAYRLELGSASGASGDVVAVPLTLYSDFRMPGDASTGSLMVLVCHDPEVLEPVGDPEPSDELDLVLGPGGVWVFQLSGDRFLAGEAQALIAFFLREDYNDYFVSGQPLAVATLYYRLIGSPGQAASLKFCDGELEVNDSVVGKGTFCAFNELLYLVDRFTTRMLSTRNQPGTITITDGPATNPFRPAPQPEAEIYPEGVTPEQANVRVRAEGGVAAVGELVEVPVHVTADVEYTGVMIPINFDERYLSLERVENRLPAGFTLRNDRDEIPGDQTREGTLVVSSAIRVGNRRVAEKGVEFHAATVFFRVKPEASSVGETSIQITPVISGENDRFYGTFVNVRTEESLTSLGPIEPHAEVEPVFIRNANLKIVASRSTFLADVTFDGTLDLADPVSLLGYLFLGEEPPDCLAAADVDRDDWLSIADPINMLTSLFLGDPKISSLKAHVVDCFD